MRLDSPYCGCPGLNLSWEVLEGLAKHNGPVTQPGWALAELDAAFPLDWAAGLARSAGRRAGGRHRLRQPRYRRWLARRLPRARQLLELDFVADQWREVEKRFPQRAATSNCANWCATQIGLMVNDLLETTRANLQGIGSADEVRGAGCAIAAFSPEMAQRERTLKAFMYANLYHHDAQIRTAQAARSVIAKLYAAYDQDASLMNSGMGQDPARSRTGPGPAYCRFHCRDDRPLCDKPIFAYIWRKARRFVQCLRIGGYCW